MAKTVQIPVAKTLSLAAKYYQPEANKELGYGVVLVHGFAGTPDKPGRLFPRIAHILAKCGYHVLLPYQRGCGGGRTISEGVYGNTNLTSHLDDLDVEIDWLATRCNCNRDLISTLGFSLGAAMVLEVRKRGHRPPWTALISPAFRPLYDMWPRYRSLVDVIDRQENMVNKPGSTMLLGKPSLHALRVDLGLDVLHNVSTPTFVGHSVEDARITVETTRDVIKHASCNPNVTYVELSEGSHSIKEPGPQSILLEAFTNWLPKTSSS